MLLALARLELFDDLLAVCVGRPEKTGRDRRLVQGHLIGTLSAKLKLLDLALRLRTQTNYLPISVLLLGR